MISEKTHIISNLKRDLLVLQGFKQNRSNLQSIPDLGPINDAFPNKKFPLSAMHEFITDSVECKAASIGFINGILSSVLFNGGVGIWIGTNLEIYPPALSRAGIEADQIIFIAVRNEKEAMYCMEEALKCNGISTVIGELKDIDFTLSRRYQLAVEQSGVTGFIIRPQPKKINTTACVTRWKIQPLPGLIQDDMPGIGFPQWNIELLKVRNGYPGSWTMEWSGKKFKHIPKPLAIEFEEQLKTG